MKATVIVQIFDYSSQEPGNDEVYVFRTNKAQDEVVNENGDLTKECYKEIKQKDLYLYENLCGGHYEIKYVPDSKIQTI